MQSRMVFDTIWTYCTGACAVLTCLAALSSPLRATPQTQADLIRQLATMSNEDVTRRLAQSGLTRNEVRDQLSRAGYSPFLADQYYEAIIQGAEIPGAPDPSTLDAFQRIGLITPEDLLTDVERPVFDQEQVLDVLDDDSATATLPSVFGTGVFFHQSLRFDPYLAGPVGDDYTLGPGDVITLVISGDVERVHERLTISRRGDVYIPQVGLLGVQGHTLGELRDVLYRRLSQVYSGIRREAGSTTTFTVTVVTLRAIQVRVLGEVIRPGAYQLSSIGTFLQALYYAGGPTEVGSYRRILLSRRGEEPVEVDVYPYLTSGSISGDPRLRDGDVIFVPPVERQATIRGAVRRQATFELKENEGLKELIELAGGLLPVASTDLVQVNRILPPSERSKEVERVIVNAPLDSVLADVRSFGILPGDDVLVDSVSDEVRNVVELVGGVRRPGTYELVPGLTVGTAIERAGGLLLDAESDRVRLRRIDEPTGKYVMASSSVDMTTEVHDRDIIEVYVSGNFSWQDSVEIRGMVRAPGRYALATGMRPGDLVLLAQGFSTDATTEWVEVARRTVGRGGDPEVNTLVVQLDEAFHSNTDGATMSGDDAGIAESDFVLQPEDRVFVRRRPGSRTAGVAEVGGELVRPGTYPLLLHGERLSSVVARAGGLTSRANSSGLQLRRGGVLVGADFQEALRQPESDADPVLQDGDSVYVPTMDNTVTVLGSVNFPSRTIFAPAMTMGDALASAGGTTADADLDRLSIRYADGTRAVARKHLGLFRSYPPVRPGSSIFVPIQDEEAGVDWASALGTTATILQAVAVNIIAILSLAQADDSSGSSPAPGEN